MTSTLDALVLDSHARGSLAVARQLGRGGHRVAMGAYDPGDPGLRTRYAAETALFVPPSENINTYADQIIGWLREHPADVVLTSSDQTATALLGRRDEIEQLTRLGLASTPAMRATLNKEETLEAGRRAGVPGPRSIAVTSAADVVSAADELGYPCVLKPDESWRVLNGAAGQRVVCAFLASPDDARREGEVLVAADTPGLIQEFAPGRREAITVLRQDGRLVASFAMAATRTWPPLGGSSVMRESVRMPADSLRHAVALTEEIGYEGYGEVEFRRAADGRPLLMEINPRFSASVELALLAGVDFATMQLEWARGGRLTPSPGYRVGVRLSWLEGELRLVGARLIGAPEPRPRFADAARDLVADYVPRLPRIDGLNWRDPMPTVAAAKRSLSDVLHVATGRQAGGR